MALYLADSSKQGETSIRGLVENCAHNDDITPLAKLVFEAQSLADSPSTVAADGQQMVSIINTALKAVAAEQASTIDDICHSNALAIAETVAEIEQMNLAVEEVKAAMVGANQAMQGAGVQLVDNVQRANQLVEVQDNLQQASAAVVAAQGVLQQCLSAGELIKQHKLYPALCMLDKIRKQHLAALLSMLANSGSLQPSINSPYSVAACSRTTDAAHLQRLHSFFSGLVDDMTAAVQRLALQGFNHWLVSMRAGARNIGLNAIQAAAVERSLEEGLASERKAVLTALSTTAIGGGSSSSRNVRDIAAELSGTLFRQDLLKEAVAEQARLAQQRQQQQQGDDSKSSSSLLGPGLRELLKRPGKSSSSPSRDTKQTTAGGADGPPGELPALQQLHPGEPEKAIRALLQHQQQKQKRMAGGFSAAAGRSPQTQQQQLQPPTRAVSSGGSRTSSNPSSINSLLDFDMSGCHAVLHVAKSLGQLESFRQYYLEQRRLQLSADLQPPGNFLEAYQAYLAQVTGSFVIESYVQRVTDGLVGGAEGTLLWEGAARSLKTTLAAAFDGLDAAPLLLMVKDFVVLVCLALERAGYQVASVTEVLLGTRGRYHDLLAAHLQQQLAGVVDADVLDEVEIRNEAQHMALVQEYGLPWQLEGAAVTNRRLWVSESGLPPLPYTAPFTSSVPQVLGLVRRFVSDSLAYLRGLLSAGELLPAVLQHRDRMLSKVVNDVLSAKARSIGSNEEMMREAMRCAANAWALSYAMDGLDDWTIHQARPGTETAAQVPSGPAAATKAARVRQRKHMVTPAADSSDVQATFKALQDASERDVLWCLTARIDQLLDTVRRGDWLPPEPLAGSQSSWVDALLSTLQESFDAGFKLLPRSSVAKLMSQALQAAAAAITRLLGPEGVRNYNLYAIEKLAFNIATIERFASRWNVGSLAVELVEPKQLCALLLSGKLDDILVPEVHKQRYPALHDLLTVATALDKYKEVPQQAKKWPDWPTKKAVGAVAKQLRAQLAAETAAATNTKSPAF